METDGLESAMCQNPREGTHWELFKFLMIMRQKGIVYIFFLQKSQKREGEDEKRFYSSLGFDIFRKRGSGFSIRFLAIGPSEFFGLRRKVVLRGKGNAWASVLRSFDKLHEVGVLSYLSYILFKCFVDG